MKLEVIAGKYAKALLALALEKGVIEKIERELVKISEILNDHPRLEKALCQPSISREEKSRILNKICEKLGLSVMIKEFFILLARNGRLCILKTISEIYKDEAFLLARRLKVEVESPSPLSSDEKDKLKARLGRIFNRSVLLKLKINRSLIGGIRIRVGHTLYDGTIRAGLDKMREVLV